MYIVIPHMKTDGDSDSLDEIVSAIDVDVDRCQILKLVKARKMVPCQMLFM